MLEARDIRGVMGMMPAFATQDAHDLRATSTIAVDNLMAGVDRIINDGINVIATTGSFGELHTLLDDELQTLARATVEAARKRVPVIIGGTALNTRHALAKMKIAQDAGADGVLMGVPFYFPATVDNAIEFYREIAEMFPKLGIIIYHNPPLHNVTLPVEAFQRLREIPNLVGMKDSHRGDQEFVDLIETIQGRISVMVNGGQYLKFSKSGAAGCWSINAWLGPWPVLRLRDAIWSGNEALAQEITEAMRGDAASVQDLHWRESTAKLAAALTGYVQPGPLRPPFQVVPEEVQDNARKLATAWSALCEKYRAPVGEAVPA